MNRYTASRMGNMRKRADLAAPCKGCEKRHIKCHAECREYADWKYVMSREYDQAAAGLKDQKARSVARAAKRADNKGKWRWGL